MGKTVSISRLKREKISRENINNTKDKGLIFSLTMSYCRSTSFFFLAHEAVSRTLLP